MGFIALFTLSAYAGTSALLLARRFYTESRAEAWLAGAAIWLIGILAPIHALGWLGQLTPGALGVVSVVLSSATLALALRASSATASAADTSAGRARTAGSEPALSRSRAKVWWLP